MDLILDVNIQIYPVDLGTPPGWGAGGWGGGRPGLLRAGSAWCWAVPSSQGCVVLALCWG